MTARIATGLMLAGLLVLLAALPVAAQPKPVGENFNVLFEGPPEKFPAGEPFHVIHGWCLDPISGAKPISGWTFDLTIDGVEQDGFLEVDGRSQGCLALSPEPMLRRSLFNYQHGLPVGIYEFQGYWDNPADPVFTPGPYTACFYDNDPAECD